MLKKRPDKKLRFGEWAVRRGFLTEDQFKVALSKKKNLTDQMVGNICVLEGFITDEQKAEILAAQFSLEYVKIEKKIGADLSEKIPLSFMKEYQVIPYEKNIDTLFFAVAEPLYSFFVEDRLELITGMNIVTAVASETVVKEILKQIELKKTPDEMQPAIAVQGEQVEKILSFEKISSETSNIIRLIDSTILNGIDKRASDIHFETSETGIIIRYRIDGMLVLARDPVDIQLHSQIISRIKVMAELDISEKRIPQDGRFKLKAFGRYIDFRISILPSIFGEDAVIRILDQQKLSEGTYEFSLSTLGLPSHDMDVINRMINVPYGMFLMTGPTGSGKTTTLYTALSEVNQNDIKIITIEDPVEYQLKGVVQIPVNEKKGLTFAKGLRSILRHDPDKILVGEIRDAETAQIALQSALTGHLVFTTVHANNSFEVINRFTHMGIAPYNLMAALNCIIAQRLIRTLCTCKVEISIPQKTLEASAVNSDQFSEHIIYGKKGCAKCNGTGFMGRKAILEIVELNDTLKELFIKNASIAALKKATADSGTAFLREAAIREVLNGTTTLDEANRVTFIGH